MRELTRDQYNALCSQDYGERFLLMVDQFTWVEAASVGFINGASNYTHAFVGSKIRFNEGYYSQEDMQEALDVPDSIAEATYFTCDTSEELKAVLKQMTVDLLDKVEFRPV